ncbi:MAG TPA: hypothetical protein VIK38_13235 [Coriobacteriia bacterium]
MSDQDMTPVPAGNPVIANAQQALAVKELGEAVAGMKQKMKTMWITVIVLAVVTLVLVVLTALPFMGVNLRAGGFNRAQFQNGTFQPGTGGAPGAPGGPGGTTPGQ